MIYPAVHDITILQNATWRGVFRATQNRQEVAAINVSGTVPAFSLPCHKLVASDSFWGKWSDN